MLWKFFVEFVSLEVYIFKRVNDIWLLNFYYIFFLICNSPLSNLRAKQFVMLPIFFTCFRIIYSTVWLRVVFLTPWLLFNHVDYHECFKVYTSQCITPQKLWIYLEQRTQSMVRGGGSQKIIPFLLFKEHFKQLTLSPCVINKNVIFYVSSWESFSHSLLNSLLLPRLITYNVISH